MAVCDLKTQISLLVKLQELDSQIYALGNELKAKPLEIRALELNFEGKKQGLIILETKALDLEKARKEKELDLGANAEATKKLQGQLYALKTNTEFQIMQPQIADIKADGAVIEEKILIF